MAGSIQVFTNITGMSKKFLKRFLVGRRTFQYSLVCMIYKKACGKVLGPTKNPFQNGQLESFSERKIHLGTST